MTRKTLRIPVFEFVITVIVCACVLLLAVRIVQRSDPNKSDLVIIGQDRYCSVGIVRSHGWTEYEFMDRKTQRLIIFHPASSDAVIIRDAQECQLPPG